MPAELTDRRRPNPGGRSVAIHYFTGGIDRVRKHVVRLYTHGIQRMNPGAGDDPEETPGPVVNTLYFRRKPFSL